MASALLFGVAVIGCKEKTPSIDGDWIGILTVNGKTDHGVLHVRTDGEGKLTVSPAAMTE